MARIFKKPYRVKLDREKNEEQEFGPGKPGMLVCRVCGAVYHRKAWRHGLGSFGLKSKARAPKTDTPVSHKICPACEMIRHKQFEGEIVIENVPRKDAPDILNLIDSFGRSAYSRDCQDRVISVESSGDRIRATTTENQLAKKIQASHKKAKLEVGHASAPSDVARARIIFPVQTN